MTTICASRQHGQMAADTRVNVGDNSFPSKKIVVVGGCLAGAAGNSMDCSSFFAWLESGADHTKVPTLEGSSFEALVLSHEGLFYYEADCCPNKIERDYHAIGTGGTPALAALICGKTPQRAVEIACQIDSNSGKPVTVLRL